MRRGWLVLVTAFVFGIILAGVGVGLKVRDAAGYGMGGGGNGGGGNGGGGHSGGGYGGGGATGNSTLAFEPQDLVVPQGGAAKVKVTVALASGRTWGTSLTAPEVPAGVTVTFNPASGDPPFVSTMTVAAAPTAKEGTFTVKVQATGGDPSLATPYKVSVTKGATG